MSEGLNLILALVVGAALGVVFFGGLWWTVLKGVSSRTPAIWFLASMLVRTGITLVGFYFIARGHWQRLLMCLLGFVIARIVITRLTRIPAAKGTQVPKEPGHAS
jgi:F1F0 ATPase subunit 2